MPDTPKASGLDLPLDPAFEKWEWRGERIGWALMLLVILAAMIGLFGKGMLSHASKTAADGSLSIEYERFLHYHDPARLRVVVAANQVRDGQTKVWLSTGYLEAVALQKVTPDPIHVEAGSEGHTFVFHVPAGQGPITIMFDLEAEEIGTIEGLFKAGGETLSFSQFVYP